MTSGEGTSYGGGGGGGGVGGKFRKTPSRRHQTTPYDLPHLSPSLKPRADNNSGWLPKLILSGARSFFSHANGDSRDRHQDAVPNNSPRVEAPVVDNGGNSTNIWNGSGISKLEQLLQQKTFSRAEVERLTEILHSNPIDIPTGDDHTVGGVNVAYGIRHDVSSSPIQHNVMETNLENRFHGHVLTPLVSSHVSEKDVASPAELAKAYMGSRPSKVSPSQLHLRSQALTDDTELLDNASYPPKAPVVGIPENGFMNPRSQGGSAVCDMAHTPYSNMNPTARRKVSSSVYDSYGGPSASPSSVYLWEHDAQRGSKQLALKRRISALEDEIGSITPIRRLRQKTNLSTPENWSLPVYRSPLSSHGTGLGSNGAQQLVSSNRESFPVEDSKYRTLHTGNKDNSTPSTSYTPIPSQSNEMAMRILEQLEKLVPKVKPSGDKSPSLLTPSMLRGQALRSLEYVDSSKILQNAQESHKLDELRDNSQLDACGTTSRKQENIEDNGPEKLIVSHETVASVGICGTMVSVKDSVAGVHTAGSVISATATQPPQKKWAFRMSADEDFLDLDDDIHHIEATSTQLSQEEEKQEKFMLESKVAYSEAVMVSKTSTLSVFKPPDGPVITNSADLRTSDASLAGEKSTFSSLTVPASSTTLQPIMAALQSTPAFDSIIPLKESNSTPVFISADSKIVDKVPSLSFSSSSTVSESLLQKSNAPPESKPECSNSFANSASGTGIVIPKVPESDNRDYDDGKKSVEMTAQSEISSSASVSASSIFSLTAPANMSGLNNGSLSSSPRIFSSSAPVPVSVDFTNQKVGNSFTYTAPSTTVTASTHDAATISASHGIVSSSSAASSFPVAPIFTFEPTAGAPSNPVSTISTTSSLENTDIKAKTDKESTLSNGNLSNMPLGGTSFGTASTGSNIFGFSASATSSAVYNPSQSSLFDTTTGSLAITQKSPAETGVTTVMQSMPIQFGSSFTSSNSIFGSSSLTSPLFSTSTSPKLFDSTFSAGLSSSSASSLQINAISSGGAATSSLFGTNWQPTANTSVSPSAMFPFGASSTSASSTNKVPMVFSSGIPMFATLSGNGDQMSMEDSMSEDPVQVSAPAVPTFSQPSISAPSSGSMFNSPVSSGGIPLFQFGNQQNQSTPQLPPPFQPSGSLEFGASNSFSLGSAGGGDKSGRRILKNRSRRRP